ncbi:DUF72 domain-containing protein [Niabella sp. W65]|nr:DUF72 domain-containing protein [Niabella sp. W65]MCH7368741.1 DUF72 domain-containing protein [Niabella sp. W65]ULT46207.1 DUF72 domain-containing protein [Niabella sp. I65]
MPLAVEVRNENWFADPLHWSAFCDLLQKKKMANIIVDTAGRRDMVHMRLTTPEAFIRFVGCNDDAIDKKRLDDWLKRIKNGRKKA